MHTALTNTVVMLFGVAVALFAQPQKTSAQCEAKFTPGESERGAYFGYSVDQDGDYLVVGFPRFESTGKASVYRREGSSWLLDAELMPDDDQVHLPDFGGAVAISGDYIVVGADGEDQEAAGDTGAAYVFHREGVFWVKKAKLTASDATGDDSLGRSVSIDGDYIVVAAGDDNSTSGRDGAAYVFRREGTNWVEEAKLISDTEDYIRFGWGASISGDTVAVRAAWDSDACPDSDECKAGSVYIFRRVGTEWTQEAKLTASDPAANARFGSSVSVDGEAVVIGSGATDEVDPNNPYCDSGTAYIFRRTGTTWVQEAKLLASDATCRDLFGLSVSICGDDVVVGAPHHSSSYTRRGAAYVFQREGTNWIEKARVTASNGQHGDDFGWSVSIEADDIAVGAYDFDPPGGGYPIGAAYTYSVYNAVNFSVPNFGDLNEDSTVNIFDLFCVLNGFGGVFAECSFENVDIHPRCERGNGVINIDDLFAALSAFGGPAPWCCE